MLGQDVSGSVSLLANCISGLNVIIPEAEVFLQAENNLLVFDSCRMGQLLLLFQFHRVMICQSYSE